MQGLLNDRLHDAAPLKVDGDCGTDTIAAIKRAQTILLGMAKPDGLVSPDGPTIHALSPVTPTLPPVIPHGIPAEIVSAAQSAQALRNGRWRAAAARTCHPTATILSGSRRDREIPR